MIKHLLIGSLTLAASILAGCTQPKPAPEVINESLPAQSFRREWQADLNLKDDHVERIFLKEDVVIVYSARNMAYVLNRNSGRIRFSAQIPLSPVKPHPPVVLKEKIVFPTASTLEIYRRTDGRFERSYDTRHSLRTDAVGWPGGTKLFMGVDTVGAGRMVCVETMPGLYKPVNERWELMSTTARPIDSAPAVYLGVVYTSFADGQVYAVNADSRAPIWSTSTGQTFATFGPVQADLRADEYGVYVPSTDTKFYCLDRTQGKVKWQFFAGTSLRDTPEITSTMVYLPTRGRGILAIDKVNGPAVREPKWAVRDCVKLIAEDEKFAYFQRNDNVIVALDKNTGEQKFTNKRGGLSAFATNTKDGTVFAATKNGMIYAIKPVLTPGTMGEVAWIPVPEGLDMLASR